jgi:hypothetical protein
MTASGISVPRYQRSVLGTSDAGRLRDMLSLYPRFGAPPVRRRSRTENGPRIRTLVRRRDPHRSSLAYREPRRFRLSQLVLSGHRFAVRGTFARIDPVSPFDGPVGSREDNAVLVHGPLERSAADTAIRPKLPPIRPLKAHPNELTHA